MYTKESFDEQLNLSSDGLLAPFLDPENELFKIAKTLDWVRLSDKLSDKNTLRTLKENIYAQHLCNISLEGTKRCLNSSTLTYFRKQVGLKGIKFIEEEVLASLKRAKLLKNKILICDTTIVPANISYPTDISLLEKVLVKAVGLLKTAQEFGAKAYRTYKRTAKRVFIRYQKIRHHTVKFRRKTQKQLRQFAQRNLRQLKEALGAIEGTLKKAALDTASSLHRAKENLVKETKDFLATAGEIVRQQNDIYRNLPAKERIVSLDKPYLRPMVRGKYHIEVEFGPKILLNLKNNFLFLEHLSFNNISDSHLLGLSLKGYQERFGSLPTQLAADRGFWSKENYRLAQETHKIDKVAIENKGKSSYLAGKPFRERLRRARCRIEAKISLAKRKYGLGRALYSIANGEEIWIRLGLMTMNLKTAVGYG